MKLIIYGIRGFPDVQGGVEKHCEELYTKLSDLQVTVIRRKPYVNSNKTYPNITFKDIFAIKNKYLETPIHSFLSALYCIFNRPDIVHIHNIGPALTLSLLKLFRIKTVVTYHSSNYEHEKWNKLAKFVFKVSEKIMLKLADKIIFVSENKKESIGKNDKCIAIPNGITNFDSLIPTANLKEYNLENKKYILCVGRIVPEKRFIDVIKAIKNVPNINLVIAGSHDNDDNYVSLVKKFTASIHDRVVFTGHTTSNNLKLLYEHAYLFILPSENEGMPIVLLEAMAFGLPCLVSNIQENLDITQNKYGLSFIVKDTNDLTQKLDYMIKNTEKIQIMGKLAQAHVKKTYQWDNIAKQTLEVYNTILRK